MKKILTILTITAGLFAACNSDNDGLTPADKDERVSLDIVATIKAQTEAITRASETSWDDGDQIGVFVTAHDKTELYKDGDKIVGNNLKFTFNDGTNYETEGKYYRSFAPDPQKIYLSAATADVYGYYPYTAKKKDNSTDLDPAAIEIDVSDQSSQKNIDFMRAKKANVSNGTASIELMFWHRLVKLVFNLKQGEGLLPDELKDATYLGMTIDNQPYEANYNLYTDVFSISPGNNNIIPIRSASAPLGYVRSFEAIVLPNGSGNAVRDRKVSITFYQKSEDPITNTFTIASSTVFQPGHKYIYNITINATTIEVNTVDTFTEQW